MKNNMATISTCIIVKNEIKNIPGLVEDLRQFSDEIIIVDTGSDDGTAEWLQEHQDEVLKYHHFDWVQHFAKARNYSFSKATKDWVFWCDADDRISERLIKDLKDIKPQLDKLEYNCYYINYQFGTNVFVPRIRLLKRSDKPYWTGACHEYVVVEDKPTPSYDIFDQEKSLIIHQREQGHPARNLPIFINTILRTPRLEEVTGRDMFYYSSELRDNGYLDKARDVAKVCLTMPDMCIFDCWNAIIYTLGDYWRSTKDNAKEGIIHINKFIETFDSMRGDVWYLLGTLYCMIGDGERHLICCKNAIETQVKDIFTYCENNLYSNVFPAMDLYINSDDQSIKDSMIEHLKKYSNLKEVQDFFKENKIKFHK
jgi:glycosyltransferase involved in cell wall biosynthesis